MSLKKTFFQSVIWTSGANITQKAFTFATMLILVRLLSRADFGTATTASMFMTLLIPITRFGTYDYLIQHTDIDDSRRTSATIVTISFGALFTTLLFLLAGPISLAFSDPELADALRLISPVFLIHATTVTHEACLAKAFGFKTLAIRSTSAQIGGGLTAIALALLGFGMYSLIAQQLVSASLSSIVLALNYRWRPDFSKLGAHWREIVHMGSRYTAAQMMSSFNNTVYGLVIGLVISTEATGIFRIALTAIELTVQLTIQPFLQVAQPLFSKFRHDKGELSNIYLKLLQYCALFTFFLFGWMAMMGPEIGHFVYGPRFGSAGQVMSLLCLAVFSAAPNYLIGVMLGAAGHPGKLIKLSIAQSASSAAMAVLAAPFGLNAVALAFCVRGLITSPLSLFYLHRVSGVRFTQVGAIMAMPMTFACVMMASVYVIDAYVLASLQVLPRLAFSGAFAVAIYGGFITVFRPDVARLAVELVTSRVGHRVRAK